ncbi:hypothetical protein H1R20_g7195, partial [Candolleomyces eurysporus]
MGEPKVDEPGGSAYLKVEWLTNIHPPKRNRDTVFKWRRRDARQKKESGRVEKPAQSKCQAEVVPPPRVEPTKSKLKVIQDQVRRLSQRFERALAQKSPDGYLSLLCIGFEIHYEQGYTTRAKDYIMGREVEFRKIQKSLEKYRGMVEEIDGIGEEWKRIDKITSEVRKVVCWIDNLLCSAMVDPANLVNRFHAKQLEFQ